MYRKIGVILALLVLALIGLSRSGNHSKSEARGNNILASKTNPKESGSVLGKGYRYGPHIYLTAEGTYAAGGVIPLTSMQEPVVEIQSYGVNGTAQADIYKADLDSLLKYIAHDKDGKQNNSKTDISSFTKLAGQSISIADNDTDDRIILPIGEKETGIWFIKLTYGSAVTESFVVRSGIGVTAKNGDNQLIFWGQNFESKRSIGHGDITVYSLLDGKRELGSAGFGNDGIAITGLSAESDIAIAKVDDDIAIVPLNLKYLNFGYSSINYHPKNKKTVYFVFTDRPIYKPGDTLYFKSILRDDDDARYAIPTGIARVQVYKDWDENNAFYDQNTNITADGTVYGALKLPDDIGTGNYSLKISVPKPKTDYPDYTWEDNTVYFQVEYFRKPEFGIDITTDAPEIVSGDRLRFNVTGSYFSGQPLTGDVSYKIYSSDYWDYDYYYDEYKPQIESDYRWGYWGSKEVRNDRISFDTQGRASVDIQYRNPSENTKNQVISIEATFDNGSGNPSFARKNILVRSGLYSIFRKDSWRNTKVGEELQLPVIAVGVRNTSVSGIELTAKVKREQWIAYAVDNQKYPSYRQESEDLGVLKAVTDQSGNAVFKMTPSKPGSYTFTVTGTDTQGNTIARLFYKWVTLEGEIVHVNQSENGLQITANKEQYQPGDTAILTLTSAIPDRDVLLSLDRAKVNRYQVVHMTGKSDDVSIPVVATDMPNIFASVSSFDNESVNTSEAVLKVPALSKKITYRIMPDRERYGPGDTVTLNVESTDPAGNPVSADTAVWTVDKALFELVDQQPLRIFEQFWQDRYNYTQFSHSLEGIMVNMAEGGGCFLSGTDILMEGGRSKAIENIKPGERILTRKDTVFGALVPATVTSVAVRNDRGYVVINGQLRVTPDHLLYAEGGWVQAGSLQRGDKLLGTDGKTISVRSVEWLASDVRVYNLEIEKYHTFFADGIWVHNQKGGGGGREIFKDTAYWNPSLHTDSNGRAQVRFKLPDNLTTWVIAAVGATGDTKVGKATTEIVVSKDVIVRPVVPNILRVDDRMNLAAMVQNFTGKERMFAVSLSGDQLTVEGEKTQRVMVGEGGSVQVSWNVTPKSPKDQAKITYSAVDESDTKIGDTVAISIPIRSFGFIQREVKVGNGPSDVEITLFPDAVNDQTKLSLSLSPSLVGSLIPAMRYLVDYPYGCIEQTTSRFVPAVIAKLNPSLFKSALEDKDLDAILAKGIAKISGYQQSDGGWTWWYYGVSDPFVTAYVTEYLLAADSSGAQVDTGMLGRAKNYFQQMKNANATTTLNKDTDVIREYALGLFPDTPAGKRLTYHDGSGTKSPDILAMEIMANYRSGFTDPAQNGLNTLLSLAKPQGETVYWDPGSRQNFGSRNASTAYAIRAILTAQGDRTIAVKAARYLVEKRQYDYWSNTFATSQVVRALTELTKTGFEDDPNLTYRILLDNKQVGGGTVASILQEPVDLKIPTKDIKAGGSEITIAAEGTGQLYWVLTMDQFRTDRSVGPESHGLTVIREYINGVDASKPIGIGDPVTVRITLDGVSDEEYYGVIEDELPAGFIPVVESLKNEQFLQNPRDFWSVSAREYTQNGVILSAYRFGGGKRIYEYKARAISAGEFIVPPARASLMYSPETNGRTGVTTVKVGKLATPRPVLPQIQQNQSKNRASTPTVLGLSIIGLSVLFLLGLVVLLVPRFRSRVVSGIRWAMRKPVRKNPPGPTGPYPPAPPVDP
jgi:alpha-2-macroglobulin